MEKITISPSEDKNDVQNCKMTNQPTNQYALYCVVIYCVRQADAFQTSVSTHIHKLIGVTGEYTYMDATESLGESELRRCVNREVGLGSHSLCHFHPSLISRTVSVDVNHRQRRSFGESALRSCVKVEVAVLGSPSLIVLTVSVHGKQHWKNLARTLSKH